MRNLLIFTIALVLTGGCGRFSPLRTTKVSIPTLQTGGAGGSSEIKALHLIGKPTMVTVDNYSIPVYPSMSVDTTDTTYSLGLTGYGIRQQTVVIVTVNVYLAASYVTQEQLPIGSDVLRKLSQAPVKILQMTLVRDVSGDQLKSALSDALIANDIDPEDPSLVSLFSPLSNGLTAGETTLTIAYSTSSMDTVISVTPKQSQTVSRAGMGMDLWKMWFGVTPDSESLALKNALLGN